jgi:hypothetical protein
MKSIGNEIDNNMHKILNSLDVFGVLSEVHRMGLVLFNIRNVMDNELHILEVSTELEQGIDYEQNTWLLEYFKVR